MCTVTPLSTVITMFYCPQNHLNYLRLKGFKNLVQEKLQIKLVQGILNASIQRMFESGKSETAR